MKIAVAYENGQIFQHFGHTEQFKIYTVKDGKIVSSEVRCDHHDREHGEEGHNCGSHGCGSHHCGKE